MKNIMDKSSRIDSISYIRVISLFLIISCHILQGLGNKWAFWINVGVQIFFFMSGFLYGKKQIEDIKHFYKTRIKKILFPFMILYLIVLFLEYNVLKHNYSFAMISSGFLGFCGFKRCIRTISHTWFVSYIMLCYIMVPIFQKEKKKKNFKNNLCNFIVLVIFIQLLQEFFVINIKSSWINNFIIGYFYSKCCDDKKSKKIFIINSIILFILIFPFAIIFQEKLDITTPNIINSHSNLFMQYGHVLLGTLIFWILYYLFNKMKIKKFFVIDFFDKYSYYIYLTHQIFILFSFSLLSFSKYLLLNIIIIFICSIVSGILLKIVCDFILHFLEKIYRLCFNKFSKIF